VHRGYIKLWRKSFDSGLHKDPKTFLLWHYILCNVTYKEIEIVFNRKKVNLMPGEMATTLNNLAEPLFLSIQNIRTSLKNLEMYGNLTSKVTNKFRIITVINWESYQQTEIPPNKQANKCLTSASQVPNKLLYNKQEDKKVKKVNNTYACAWPKDFILTPEMKSYAIKKGINAKRVDAFFDDFRNWAAAKGATYKDWQAAFRTRVGKAQDYGKQFLVADAQAESSDAAAERLKKFRETM